MPLFRRTTVKKISRPGSACVPNGIETIDKDVPRNIAEQTKSPTQRPNLNGPSRYAWGEVYPSDDIIARIRCDDTISEKDAAKSPRKKHNKESEKHSPSSKR